MVLLPLIILLAVTVQVVGLAVSTLQQRLTEPGGLVRLSPCPHPDWDWTEMTFCAWLWAFSVTADRAAGVRAGMSLMTEEGTWGQPWGRGGGGAHAPSPGL